jgi:hypothetical protein
VHKTPPEVVHCTTCTTAFCAYNDDMKVEEQVCSLELAKKLKELGVGQNGLYVWVDNNHAGWEVELETETVLPVYPSGYCVAFTVAELGELLPLCVETDPGTDGLLRCYKLDEAWQVGYFDMENNEYVDAVEADTEADARAKMLIYLLENKLVDATQLS